MECQRSSELNLIRNCNSFNMLQKTEDISKLCQKYFHKKDLSEINKIHNFYNKCINEIINSIILK